MKTKFNELPDYMSSAELKKYFEKFISIYKNSNELVDSLEELDELAERQWHTYELLSDDIKSKIEKYLANIIDYESYEVMDLLFVIIPKLGLVNIYNVILKKQKDIKNPEVLRIINQAQEEYGEDVSNPYSGM